MIVRRLEARDLDALAELESLARKRGCSQIQFITERERKDAVVFL